MRGEDLELPCLLWWSPATCGCCACEMWLVPVGMCHQGEFPLGFQARGWTKRIENISLMICKSCLHVQMTVFWYYIRQNICILISFLKYILFIFRVRGREAEREENISVGEKHQCVVASCTPPAGDLARNPGLCPDWESNRWPFSLQAGAQSTEPQHPGLEYIYILKAMCLLER